jgi:ABC-type molybdate transport system substrate-binding protein
VTRGKTKWYGWFRAFSLILSALFAQGEARAQGKEIRIAAAADLKFAMAELSEQFEKQTGTKVNVTFGSSGNFFSQIENGAPFDLFFSADIEYPRKLEAAGLTEPGTLYEYAIGRIVIWAPSDAKVDVTKLGWKSLRCQRREDCHRQPGACALWPRGRCGLASLRHLRTGEAKVGFR